MDKSIATRRCNILGLKLLILPQKGWVRLKRSKKS